MATAKRSFNVGVATANELMLFESLKGSSGDGGGGGSDLYLWNIDASIITAQKSDNTALTSAPVGRRTQVMPIYVPFDCEVLSFRTQTLTSGTLCLVSFGIYSFTNPIGLNQQFSLIGGATDYDCSAADEIIAQPDSTITLTKGWYMLAMFRNAAAAGQDWLQFANNSLLPVFGWNTFLKNDSQKLYYENTTVNLASSGLPATIDSTDDLDYSGTSNILAYGIRLGLI